MNPVLKYFIVITAVFSYILNTEAMGLCAFRSKFPDKHPVQCGGSKVVTCKEKDLPTVEDGNFKCSGYYVGDKCNLICEDGYYPSSSKETVCEEKDSKGKWREGTFQCTGQQQTTFRATTTSQAAEETTPAKSSTIAGQQKTTSGAATTSQAAETPAKSTTITGQQQTTLRVATTSQAVEETTPAKSTTVTGQQQTTLRAATTIQAAEETTPAKSTTITGQQQTTLMAATTIQAAEETTPAKSTTITGHQQTTLRAATTSQAAEETTPSMLTTTTAVTCQEEGLPIVQFGYFNCSGYSVGDNCNMTCYDGYYPSLSKETICEERGDFKGNWTDGNFQCSAMNCLMADQPTVQAGYFSCLGYSVGDKCYLACDHDCSEWNEWKGKEYKVITSVQNWTESREECQGENADLVSIEDEEENHFVHKMLLHCMVPGYVWKAWIGFYIESEGVWEWSDGTNGTYRNWKEGQPVEGQSKNCTVMDGYFLDWYNLPCNQDHQTVCEKK